MSEPLLPIPGPEPDSYWDPEPPRCPECGAIVDLRGRVGRCFEHGEIEPVYRSDYQTDNDDEERDG